VLAMLLGLLFRGVAFEFRPTAATSRRHWDRAFFWGSLTATYAQGCVLGQFVLGFKVAGRQFAGSAFDWVHPFVLAVGVGLVFGYVLLGATWLVMKTEGALREWASRMARVSLIGVLLFIVMVSAWTPLLHERIAERWFSWPNIALLAPVPLATLGLAAWLWRSLARQHDVAPFLAALGLFAMCYLGLTVSLFPYIVPHTLTLWDAAGAPQAQAFLLIGTLVWAYLSALLDDISLVVQWERWEGTSEHTLMAPVSRPVHLIGHSLRVLRRGSGTSHSTILRSRSRRDRTCSGGTNNR